MVPFHVLLSTMGHLSTRRVHQALCCCPLLVAECSVDACAYIDLSLATATSRMSPCRLMRRLLKPSWIFAVSLLSLALSEGRYLLSLWLDRRRKREKHVVEVGCVVGLLLTGIQRRSHLESSVSQ